MQPVGAHHLLIADDDPSLLAAYVQYFELHGYEIRATRDGVEALAEYCRWFPAVVILDVQMPRLDGREVARKIRRLRSKPMPLLVAVSGLSSQSERAVSLRSGFDHHFAKPAELPVILSAIAFRSRTRDPDLAQVQSRC
jgi:CheY-like chemotaxis protein